MYTVDYFIKKFEAIPEEKWCVGAIINSNGQRCAQGHCGPEYLKRGETFVNPENMALVKMFNERVGSVTDINNGNHSKYQQPTPKQRILAALRDIKAMQEKAQKPERVKTVYVSVPETIKEQTGELILS